MLEPSKRVSYQEILKPVSGYEIDFVLATTFSLDLNAILLASLSLSNMHYSDTNEALPDTLAVMKSLRDVKDRFMVFCQNDRLAEIPKENELIGFLDNVVITVDPGKGKSFHPKVWIVRMIRGKEVLYRVAVLSRNLTFDRSWDIAVVLDGTIGDKARHTDLADMVADLAELGARNISEANKEKMKLLQKELLRIEFESPADVSDIAFYYRKPGANMLSALRGTFNRLLIISPFVSEEVLERLTIKVDRSKNDLMLIARPDQLDQMQSKKGKEILDKYNAVFCLNDNCQVDENGEAEGNNLQGLHAKVYIARDGTSNLFFAGSANATNKGMLGGNYEFMVRLTNNSREYDPHNILEKDGALGRMILKYVPQAIMDNKEISIQSKKDELRDNIIKLCVGLEIQKEKERSVLYLRTNDKITIENDYEIFCWPAGTSKKQAILLNDKLANSLISLGTIEEAKINSYLSVFGQFSYEGEKQELRFTIKLPLIGAPPDREALLLNYIINDKSRFLKYILMLMGTITGVAPLGEQLIQQGIGRGKTQRPDKKPIVELTTEDLLRCYAYYPERFKQIKRFIADFNTVKTESAVIPEEFMQVWRIFEEALRKNNEL